VATSTACPPKCAKRCTGRSRPTLLRSGFAARATLSPKKEWRCKTSCTHRKGSERLSTDTSFVDASGDITFKTADGWWRRPVFVLNLPNPRSTGGRADGQAERLLLAWTGLSCRHGRAPEGVAYGAGTSAISTLEKALPKT
jgi:hypothetical protein